MIALGESFPVFGRASRAPTAFLIMPGRADELFVGIARSDSDAAILFIPLLGIASSLPLRAMTIGLMPVRHQDSENCWVRQPNGWSGRVNHAIIGPA
jgi:hypothetical protein